MIVKADEPNVSEVDTARSSAPGGLSQDRPAGGVQPGGRVSEFMPCPQCGSSGVNAITRVRYTWWGGLIGPKLLHHVKCQHCGASYNGETGRSNNGAITAYLAVLFIACLVLYALASAGQF